MKIGILGGSFNPPHLGHVYIANLALKSLKLDYVWFLPAKQNPLKNDGVDFRKRADLCHNLVKNNPRIKVSDFELQVKSNYIYDILKDLKKRNRQIRFIWLMGADCLYQFHLWKNWSKFIDENEIIVFDRDDFFHKAVRSRAFIYAKGRVKLVKCKKIDLSSSLIRRLS